MPVINTEIHNAEAQAARPKHNSRYENASVLRNIDLNDANSVKEVMHCIMAYNTMSFFDVFLNDPLVNTDMSPQNAAATKRMMKHIRTTIMLERPLLLLAVLRWASAVDKSNRLITKATRELVDLAPAEVLHNPTKSQRNEALYKEAFDKFQKIEASGRVSVVATPSSVSTASEDTIEDLDEDNEVVFVPSTPKTCKADGTSRFGKPSGKGKIITKTPVVPTKKKMAARAGVKKQKGPKKSEGVFKVKPEFKSCTSCKNGHVKCDRVQPTCGECVKKGKECEYERW